MKIATKLRVGSFLLTLTSTIIVGSAIAWTSIESSTQALHSEAQSKLEFLREERATQIERYIVNLRDQLARSAESTVVKKAITSFSDAFQKLQSSDDKAALENERSELNKYYQNEFLEEYKRRNNGQTIDTSSHINQLSAAGVSLQYHYIYKNPNPLGQKNTLYKTTLSSPYEWFHQQYHPEFQELLDRFGFYDIFLVDGETGNVVYTVFKELDFATSLKAGTLAVSGLGKTYKAVMQSNDPKQVQQSDFAPYFPSYDDPASFIGLPIIEGGKKIGAIIFQLPLDKINQVMTGDGKWSEIGLGTSGETYLVGADHLLRSESRFLTEDKESFFAKLQEANIDAGVIQKIKAKNTSIGLLPVNSPGVLDALKGNTGFKAYNNYLGTEVLSAYKPINIQGLQWAILAEISTEEAFAASTRLTSSIIKQVIIIAFVLTLIALFIGYLFSNYISKPISRITGSMDDISTGDGDLTVRLDGSSQDELGALARSFNTFVEKIDVLVQKVLSSSNEINDSSRELTQITGVSRKIVDLQKTNIEHIAAAVEELTVTVKEVASRTANTAETAQNAGNEVSKGSDILKKNIEIVRKLSARVQESQQVIEALSHDSETVGTVLDVIRSIAEQTNLLALNAAIEAARAGEQGRGFAVVADEVRVLAQRTQESTQEIQNIISSLQQRTGETRNMLMDNNSELLKNAELSESTLLAFGAIENSVQELLSMSTQIANATDEQSIATREISESVRVIYDESEKAAKGADETANSSEVMSKTSQNLKSLVSQFKVSNS